MKISHVKISNILGIDELEFDAGKFNEITGKNGQGKTSVLEAIKAVVRGGHEATLLKAGTKRGQIVLILDDGTEVAKTVKEGASKTTVRKGGVDAQQPAGIVKALTDAISVNPVEFLAAAKKDRTQILLESMPLQIDIPRLEKISGVQGVRLADTHPLTVIDIVRKTVYDERTATNRAVKEKEATINQLREAMPEGTAVEGNEEELIAAAEAVRAKERSELERIDGKWNGLVETFQKSINDIQAEYGTKIESLSADGSARIAEKQREIDRLHAEIVEITNSTRTAIQDHKSARDEKIAAEQAAHRAIGEKAEAQRQITKQTAADSLRPINESLAVIRSNRTSVAKREQALETVRRMERELESLIADTNKQTQAITDIDAYKEELLSTMPIKGLALRDGEIFYNGVLLDHVNTSEQVRLAVEVAKLRAGKLGLCCVDRIESMDSDTYQHFKEAFKDSGLQLFVSRVTDGQFTINAER